MIKKSIKNIAKYKNFKNWFQFLKSDIFTNTKFLKVKYFEKTNFLIFKTKSVFI